MKGLPTTRPPGMDLERMIDECIADSVRWFPGKAQELQNLVLCLCGEAGEVANLTKKIVRGSVELDDVRLELAEEIVDVLIYLCNLMGHEAFDTIDWGVIWRKKRQFNEDRFGDHREAN